MRCIGSLFIRAFSGVDFVCTLALQSLLKGPILACGCIYTDAIRIKYLYLRSAGTRPSISIGNNPVLICSLHVNQHRTPAADFGSNRSEMAGLIRCIVPGPKTSRGDIDPLAGHIRCSIHPVVPHVSQRIFCPSIKRGDIAGATYCAASITDNLIILGVPLVNILRHFQRGRGSGNIAGKLHQLPLLTRDGAVMSFPADIGVVIATLGGEVEVVVLQLDLVDAVILIYGNQSDAGILVILCMKIDVTVARIAATGGPVIVQSIGLAQAAHDLVVAAKRHYAPALGFTRALSPQANVPVRAYLLVPVHIQALARTGMGNHVVGSVSRKCHDNVSFQFIYFERVHFNKEHPIRKM